MAQAVGVGPSFQIWTQMEGVAVFVALCCLLPTPFLLVYEITIHAQ